ncbi:hypothetical protein SALWKB12_2091 [Snodgrassella communis]|uniref:hypothetical protein n=1 Tax=Snodgrassella communis TaxID=2946699 RepID=UPI000461B304|nr:hypothetical protein [Snodgrassella communis]KDN11595.1 hypothetical protein SALWKB12_2091 [Snodgrassella communis]
METGTVSFIFLIMEDGTSLQDQNEYFLEEEYYFFKFQDNDELREKVMAKIDFLKQQNQRTIIWQHKKVRKVLLGTRKFCSITTKVDGVFYGVSDSGCELAYSLFYTDNLKNAERFAQGDEVELDYYAYGNDYLAKAMEIM